MRRKNAQTIGEVLNDFFKENTELHKRILEIRIKRAWGEVLGPMIQQYTSNLYIKNNTLYVSLTSSVLRNELTMSRDKLIKSLNDYAGSTVIHTIVIR
ncbi:MAG: DUF721 domain-containing protein [Tannerellaceae bacterium]|jgi:hypothetical protein|nr:DUF721 domain-containing protein [Tannerellaceae bacterium]